MSLLIATVFMYWAVACVVGILVLYVGYGFVMCAKRADKAGLSQKWVVRVDASIGIFFVLLDAVLNIFFFSFLMLDFRYSSMFKKANIKGGAYHVPNLLTGRLNNYMEDPDERPFRKATANFFAAFLDGKDPSGDHIKGENIKFTWLG